jgi:ureidoacrylate peracid hydrolase
MGIVELSARPDPQVISSDTTALILNHMQNAFCSPAVIWTGSGSISRRHPQRSMRSVAVVAAARKARILIIHAQNGFAADLHDIPAGSPWWHKSPALRYMRSNPELKGQIVISSS